MQYLYAISALELIVLQINLLIAKQKHMINDDALVDNIKIWILFKNVMRKSS